MSQSSRNGLDSVEDRKAQSPRAMVGSGDGGSRIRSRGFSALDSTTNAGTMPTPDPKELSASTSSWVEASAMV